MTTKQLEQDTNNCLETTGKRQRDEFYPFDRVMGFALLMIQKTSRKLWNN